MTGSLIEQVKKWRDYLAISEEKLEDKPIFYSRTSNCKVNVLIELLNDSNFIFKSTLANCISMGTKNDPFLLSPFKKAIDKEKSAYADIFMMKNKSMESYQKMMEFLAAEKAHEMKLSKKDPIVK